VPVFVFQVADDFTSPTGLPKRFVEQIHAPRKAFVAIPGAGHFAVFLRPEEFLRDRVASVLQVVRKP
jgi:pimeloyl-ACP methyl ester carboxylesterase